MVNTVEAIFLTQVPIAIGIMIGAYLLYDVKRELVKILEQLVEAQKEKKR